jgi:starvation-inducible DNA-binding protein
VAAARERHRARPLERASRRTTMKTLHPTRNDLPESTRRTMITLLNERLASAIHLVIQSKVAHWNVRGPRFFQLHELFDQVYASATEWMDLIAERTAQLGGVAEGTLDVVTRRTRVPMYELSRVSGQEHLDALSSAIALFGADVRKAVDASAEAGDAATSDLFTEILRGSDKALWLLEAHLQAEQ